MRDLYQLGYRRGHRIGDISSELQQGFSATSEITQNVVSDVQAHQKSQRDSATAKAALTAAIEADGAMANAMAIVQDDQVNKRAADQLAADQAALSVATSADIQASSLLTPDQMPARLAAAQKSLTDAVARNQDPNQRNTVTKAQVSAWQAVIAQLNGGGAQGDAAAKQALADAAASANGWSTGEIAAAGVGGLVGLGLIVAIVKKIAGH